MAGVILGSDSEKGSTAVPNLFIDEYMAGANGEYVKIYLYLLRCINSAEESISISGMQDKFDHTENDIRRALRYWEKMKLLRLEFDEEDRLTGIYLVDTSKMKKAKRQRTDSVSLRREEKTEQEAPTKTYYSRDDLEHFEKEEVIQEVIFVAENLCGRTLSQTDLSSILYWYDELSFSPELIEYLIEYCSENGHKSMRYMEKVALSWKDSGITTPEEAKKLVRSRSRIYNKVVKCFGITGRGLAESELSYIDKWKKDYKYSDEMIAEACRRTMAAIQKPSFEYTDSILSNWKEKRLGTLSEVEEADKSYRKTAAQASAPVKKTFPTVNKFNNFEQRTYNYEQLEKQFEEQLLNSAHRKD